ncbi:MAG: hypothetical protein WAW96_01355 [Alphaproteobacteria bacterium]
MSSRTVLREIDGVRLIEVSKVGSGGPLEPVYFVQDRSGQTRPTPNKLQADRWFEDAIKALSPIN